MNEEVYIKHVVPRGFLTGIKFDLATNEDFEKFSSLSVVEPSDTTNPKLGLPNGSSKCDTCGSSNLKDCEGHCGVIKLRATIYHPYFVTDIVHVLNQICPGCFSIKQNMDAKEGAEKGKLMPCKYCSRSSPKWYPQVRFRISQKDKKITRNCAIVAEVGEKPPKALQSKDLGVLLPQDYWDFVPWDEFRIKPKVNGIILTPYQVFHLLKQIDREFLEQFVSKREVLFLSSFPVSSNFSRVVEHVSAAGPEISFDELTRAYRRMIDISKRLDDFRHHEQFARVACLNVSKQVSECFHASKLHSRTANGDAPSGSFGIKWLKEVLLSKRSDHAFRIVMVGDPKIRLGEIGIPQDLAVNLHVSDAINAHNLKRMRRICYKLFLSNSNACIRRNRELISKPKELLVGDLVYRPLQNGDIILINRPPSVHHHSVIALSVKVLQTDAVASINPLCCAPLLGDFDGDCLHGYIPQSFHSRAELSELVSLHHQLFNAQDRRNLVSLAHDSLVSSHILTMPDVFLNKYEMQQLKMLCHSELPLPSIIQTHSCGKPLWSGKQLFSMLLSSSINITSNMLRVQDGEVLISPIASSWLQNNTSGIFSKIFHNDEHNSLEILFSAQDVLCEYITMRGLSVSLSDMYLCSDYYSRKKLTEEVCLAINEAKEHCQAVQLLLDPRMPFLLEDFDEKSDFFFSFHSSDFVETNPHIVQASLAAFKSVFSDVLRIVLLHVRKNNSMLLMINSGSKGSLLKLVQQTLCLGLQLPAKTFPFKIPINLSCVGWNELKEFNQGAQRQSQDDLVHGQSGYAVISSSFFDGLNPLECLLHAISGRANFFSENAEVPGTLNRELMFHLRDLYVAYDGTVRSTYGQQIIQFSYDMSGQFDAASKNKGISQNKWIGAPVGSLAASSISEIAYGALDNPMHALEDSPLIKLKEILKCRRGKTSADYSAMLFLQKNLQRSRYGLEYGSLEVKNHLEGVHFSDLVDVVMIMYAGSEVNTDKFSPWVVHFHVSKRLMKAKSLKTTQIADKLMKQSRFMRKQFDDLPALAISTRSCCMVDGGEHSEICCFTVLCETKSALKLDIIQDIIIPQLLKTLLKGFLEFEHVTIQCHPDCCEPFLKVSMSEHCPVGEFWSILLNSCIPIMDLIDWERSYPDSVYNICNEYGVDAAWNYFIKCMKSVTSEIGRDINKHHLFIIGDVLSISGSFHGLSSKGLKQQRKCLSISSPFSQACFSSPAASFLEAARCGYVDNLSGTLDAVAWGKEAPIGTGGSFDILYSGKVHSPKEEQSIYQALSVMKEVNEEEEIPCMPKNWGNRSWKSFLNNDLYNYDMKEHSVLDADEKTRNSWEQNGNDGLPNQSAVGRDWFNVSRSFSAVNPSDFLNAPIGSWSNICEMHTNLHDMLFLRYKFNDYVDDSDKLLLVEALRYHPRCSEKIGAGIQRIKIGSKSSFGSSRCFILVREDGTMDDFSYRKCVIGAAKKLSPLLAAFVEKKFSISSNW